MNECGVYWYRLRYMVVLDFNQLNHGKQEKKELNKPRCLHIWTYLLIMCISNCYQRRSVWLDITDMFDHSRDYFENV